MEFDLAAIISTAGLAGIGAILAWAWRINGRLLKLEGDVEHGFESGRKTMKRHSENLRDNNDDIRALQLTAAEMRGREKSNGSLRPHRDRPGD